MPSSAATAAGPQQPEGPNPFERSYGDWRSRTCVACRYLSQGLVVCYLFSWVLDLEPVLANVAALTLYRWQVWRLVTSVLVGNSLLGSIFAALVIGDGAGPRLERANGTVSFLASIAVVLVLVNLGFCCAQLLADQSGQIFSGPVEAQEDLLRENTLISAGESTAEKAFSSSGDETTTKGVWPVVMYLIGLECLSGPESHRRLFFVDLPKKYYPLAVYCLVALAEGSLLKVDLLLGLAFAYADFQNQFPKIPTFLLQKLENILPSAVVDDPNFISRRSALGAAAFTAGHWQTTTTPTRGRGGALSSLFGAFQQRTTAGGGGTTNDDAQPFAVAGGTGHVLGDSSSSSVPAAAPNSSSRQNTAAANTAAANRATILAAAEKRATNLV